MCARPCAETDVIARRITKQSCGPVSVGSIVTVQPPFEHPLGRRATAFAAASEAARSRAKRVENALRVIRENCAVQVAAAQSADACATAATAELTEIAEADANGSRIVMRREHGGTNPLASRISHLDIVPDVA